MKILKFFTFIIACLIMAACGNSGEADKVASKIKSGESLAQADYTVMIDYCGKYAKEAQKLQDRINALPVDSEESEKLNEEMATLADKFPYTTTFFDKITTCSKEEVGQKNVKLINEYAPLMWFSAPEWASVGVNEKIDGFIEDMPSTDTTGVISTGDGAVVDDK